MINLQHIFRIVFASALLLISAVPANAENIVINTEKDTLYLNDDFDISGNTLTDNGVSGSGWSNKWSYVQNDIHPIQVHENVSLIYPSSSSAIASGGYLEKKDGDSTVIERSFIDTYGLLNTTFYLSFLVQKDASGAFALEGYGEDYLRYGLRIGETGTLEVRASAYWSPLTSAGTMANDKTYLIVLAKQGTINQVAVFQEGDSVPSDPAGVEWAVTYSGKTGVDMDRFRFVFSSGNVKIDELRLGSTLKSVTRGTTWLNTLIAPTNLTLNPDTLNLELNVSNISLNWSDNSDNETGFKIFQDGMEIASPGANVTSYVVTDMFSNPAYYFNVAAYTDEGISSKSNTSILTVINSSGICLEMPVDKALLYQTIPYFSWTHQTTEPFSGYYEIMIDDNSDFSSPEDVDTVPAFINYYSPDFELEYDLNYYWKVRFVDNDYYSENGWSLIRTFSIAHPELVIDVLPADGWDEIRAKWQTVLTTSKTTSGAVELRFPVNGELIARQDPNTDESVRSNGFLLYVDGYDNVLVNGRGSKITIEATHGEWLCGFMEVNNSSGMQVKDIIIDYHPNSLYQIGGVVKNFDKTARTFDVIVDTSVYKTYDVLKNYTEGYFLSQEHQQKIGLKGVDFQMQQSWEQARVNDTTFKFTCGTSEYGRYRDELEDGDYFVLSHRGGDVVFLSSGVDNFVLNNMTTHACRGRFFSIDAGCSTSRLLNNNYLRTQGHIMGSSSGGVGVDRGDNVWYEGNRFEYSRDDMFHNGSNAGKGSVFRRNNLIGAFRNSVWVQADRTWVAENTIEYAGSSGIHIGYAPSEPGTMPDVVLVENNTILRPNWNGIELNTNVNNPDWETGSIYNENIVIRNNHIIDNFRNEAISIEYAKNVVLENNLVTNTIDDWSVYSEKALQIGIHISNSENVLGRENKILDDRIPADSLLIIENNCSNIVLDLLNVPSSLRLTEVTSLKVDLEWKDNSLNEDSFSILRRTDEQDSYTIIAVVPENETTFSDITVQPSTKYYYKVIAENNAGISGESNEVIITTLASLSNYELQTRDNLKLTVYPNPSPSGIFQVNRCSDFIVINTLGRTSKILINTNRVDLSDIDPGLYFLKDNQSAEVCKIIKSCL